MENICNICLDCFPLVEIDRIEEGMTGREVANLLYNNFDRLNKSKANRCTERKVDNILRDQYSLYNDTAENNFINEVFYTFAKQDVNNSLTDFKELKDDLHDHLIDYTNPHKVTKDQVGLDQVDNTSDKDKPISNAVATAIDELYEAIDAVDERKIDYTINGYKINTNPILDGNDIELDNYTKVSSDTDINSDDTATKAIGKLEYRLEETTDGLTTALEKEIQDRIDADEVLSNDIIEESHNRIDADAQLNNTITNHINDKNNPHTVTKEQVGLGNVTNDVQVKRSEMGVANGVATLNESGQVPSTQLPSYVDDVLEYDTFTSLPDTGESGKIYVTLDTDLTYRWSGTLYVEISKSLALGETSSTAFPGDRGKITEEIVEELVSNDFTAIESLEGHVSEINYLLTFKEIPYRWKSDGSLGGNAGSRNITISAATTTTAGVMSADDKTILDSLASKENLIIPADEEDITSESGALKFKDREYDEANFSGKGYKILRKNIQGDKNILTLDMINESNCIYEIRYDFDLNGLTINIPENCTLKFDGGSLKNGKIFSDNRTTIIKGKPFVIEPKINDEIFFGRFWNENGDELTYKLESFKRPFSLSANANNYDTLKSLRRSGITEFEIWLSPIWDNGSKTFSLNQDEMSKCLTLKELYNYYPKHIRLQNDLCKLSESTDGIINSDTELYISNYINICKLIIDWTSENFLLTEGVFLDNEDRSCYNNDQWWLAYTSLVEYGQLKNLFIGVVTNISSEYNNNTGWTAGLGLRSHVLYNEMPVLGCNIYPNLTGVKSIKNPANQLAFDIDCYNKYKHYIVTWLYNVIQRRGYNKLYITESGISSSVYTPVYSVDGTEGGWDLTNAGGTYLLEMWKHILTRYSSCILHWNVWAIGTHRYQSADNDYTISLSNKIYNMFLNF